MELTGAHWRTSSRSGANGGNCVEVAAVTPRVAVRDSKNPDGAKLAFNRSGWASFTTALKAGRYDQ